MSIKFEHSRSLPSPLTKELLDAIFKDYGDDVLLIINQHPLKEFK